MTPRFPKRGSRPERFLRQLLVGPGTFWQICERADIELNGDVETGLRRSALHLQTSGLVRLDGIIYHLTSTARVALAGVPTMPASGQVAGPAFRGMHSVGPVRHVVAPVQVVRV